MTTRRPAPAPSEPSVIPVRLLDWRDGAHFARPERCVLCQRPTPLRSHDNEPVHKTCAETWNAAHPGETRFVSDPPKSGKGRDHA
ncbi:hypothetical protein EF919_37680 [Streptomyces sp. WAC02707]|uniref:hypothetical protein n=1 Tax=Streptomyces sp. WAC02707 TaxID=2487417 RepID=UPI000F7978FA|nr:hypothetical protein [Streptomyces sp. WAC02707]RSS85785.1 hypothetical protein EF919_37680 [Streptomyces sp. WAC02707]